MVGCDLLENSYLCGISNNVQVQQLRRACVVICLKIRTFVVSATTDIIIMQLLAWLWFAWKFVPLWYQQQPFLWNLTICLSCDLLENSYLCGISNNFFFFFPLFSSVVICLKIRTFVVSATTRKKVILIAIRCDLLENSYLCGISNNSFVSGLKKCGVVICLKIRTFVVSATTLNVSESRRWQLWFAWKFVPLWYQQQHWPVTKRLPLCCDLLENSYLCGISNNGTRSPVLGFSVVICLKIRTFVVSATTIFNENRGFFRLWFAWKFVPLWYQQQHRTQGIYP